MQGFIRSQLLPAGLPPPVRLLTAVPGLAYVQVLVFGFRLKAPFWENLRIMRQWHLLMEKLMETPEIIANYLL